MGKLCGDILPAAVLSVDFLGRAAKGAQGLLKVRRGVGRVKKAAKVAEVKQVGKSGNATNALQQVLPSKDAFLKSAEATWENGAQGTLSVAGRALQKHAGRAGSAFCDIEFSGKTANQDAMRIIKEIMNSKNRNIRVNPNGTTDVYDSISRKGFNISRKGLFNGFRNMD